MALAAIAAAGVAVSAGSAIAGAASGGDTAGGSPGSAGSTSGGGASGASTYIPANQAGADQAWQNLQTSLYAQNTAIEPSLLGAYQTQVNNLINGNPADPNNYANWAQASANGLYNLGATAANNEFNSASQLRGMGSAVQPYANQILQTGFDPQSALYNRTQQQLTDQQNAQMAKSGLSGSPYAAGIAQQGLSNFNIDWQNAQLGREAQALQGYSGAANTAGQAFAGASGQDTAALQTLQSTGQLPYQVSQQQGQNNLNSLNSLSAGVTAAQQPWQNMINNYNSYLGLGQSATGQALAGQGQGFNQSQQVGSAFGQGLSNTIGGLGNLYNTYQQNNPSTSYPSGYSSSSAPPSAYDSLPSYDYGGGY